VICARTFRVNDENVISVESVCYAERLVLQLVHAYSLLLALESFVDEINFSNAAKPTDRSRVSLYHYKQPVFTILLSLNYRNMFHSTE